MRSRSMLAATAVGVLALGIATLPAAASTNGSTPASVTVTGGGLSITVSTHSKSLGTGASGRHGARIRGPLGQVRVTDSRNAAAGAGWIASAVATDFTATSGPAIPASAIGYAAGTISKTGTVTLEADNPRDLSDATAVVTATEISGDNTASWNPTITVNLPAGVLAGTYSGTITHSVV